MDPSIEEARALVSDPALWPPVRDFLWNFAPQIHESWIEEISIAPSPQSSQREGDGLDASWTLRTARGMTSPRVDRFILESLGIEPFFHAFPKDDWSRLALIDGATLLEIAKWLGALACAEELRRVTDGKTVKSLKAALPGVYPEVFGYTAYFPRGVFQRGGAEAQSLADEVVMTGCGILLSAVAGLPSSLVSRLKLKLPSSLVSRLRDCGHGTRDERRAGFLKKLLKLKFPEAHSLCC